MQGKYDYIDDGLIHVQALKRQQNTLMNINTGKVTLCITTN